jgi:hypothetical protein
MNGQLDRLDSLAFREWPSVFGDANVHVASRLLDVAPFREGDLGLHLVETAGVTQWTQADGPGAHRKIYPDFCL